MTLYRYGGSTYESVAPAGVNVRDHGATGDGSTDDTAAINAAIQFAVDSGIRTVIVPDGTYMIQAHDPDWTIEQDQNVVFYTGPFPGGIVMQSGIHLSLSGGATLKAIPNDAKWYRIIGAAGVNNIEISGGTIEGDRSDHLGANGGEWGHGISLLSATDVYIHDLTVKNCWGDGINTNLEDNDDSRPCRRVRVARVVSDNNRRQGMSISSVVDMSVVDSVFSNTNGTAPEAGIDIESNGSAKLTTDIVIERCRLSGNNGAGLCVVDGHSDRWTVRDSFFDANMCAGGYDGQVWVNVQTTRRYRIKDNHFTAPGAAGRRNIRLSGGVNVEVSGNVMTGAPIYTTGLVESRISGNVLNATPTTAPAIEVAAAGTNVTVEGNRLIGGSIGVALTGSATADRLVLARNKISGATGAAISLTAPTTNVLVHENEAWSNGAGIFFDTGDSHTGHRVDSAWVDGTDTLPA